MVLRMTIQLTKRLAARLLKRGVNAIKIKEISYKEASKAITGEDVRTLIKNGSIYTIKKKKNLSLHGKELHKKRLKGARRGIGKKKGTLKARTGRTYPQHIRAQRRIIKILKSDNTINNEQFKKFYKLVKGGTFTTKSHLINYIIHTGVSIDEKRFNELKHA